MKKVLFLFSSLILIYSSYAQQISNISKYTCSNWWTIKEGDTITIGEIQDSAFKYSYNTPLDRKDKQFLPKEAIGKMLVITNIKKYKWSENESVIYVVYVYDNKRYYCDIEASINNGETIVPELSNEVIQKEKSNKLVRVTKKYYIHKQSLPALELYAEYLDNDTTFTMMYRNGEYQYIVDYSMCEFNKEQLIRMADGIIELLKPEYKGEDATVDIKEGCILSKSNAIGYPCMLVQSGKNGGICYFSRGQAKRMRERVYEYFGMKIEN